MTDRLAISFWIWGIFDTVPNGFYDDLEGRMAERKERGFNCIRLEFVKARHPGIRFALDTYTHDVSPEHVPRNMPRALTGNTGCGERWPGPIPVRRIPRGMNTPTGCGG